MRKCIALLVCVLLAVSAAQAQTPVPTRISGVVKDEKGIPLGGATISEKNSPSNSTMTDSAGGFILHLKKSREIMVSHVGYEPLTVRATDGAITATLKQTKGNMDDVVIIGYQGMQRRNLTAAVSSLKGKDIEDIPEASFDQMLQGRLAGVSVLSPTGEPGSKPNIVIRGSTNVDYGNSNGGNSGPLYVIDGIIYDVNAIGASYYNTNPLSLINPNDIESIDVLKDASASAIYGARAGNGVIIVKTKRATTGKPQINVSGYYGVSTQPKFKKILTGDAERDLKMNLLTSQLGYADLSQGLIPPSLTDSLNPAFNNDVDWQGLLLRSSAVVNNQDVSVGGFTGSTYYRLSFNHYSEQGLLNGYSVQRLAPSFQLSLNPVRKLNITTNLMISSEKRNHGPGTANAFFFNSWNFPTSLDHLNATQLALYKGQSNTLDDDHIFSLNGVVKLTDTITKNLFFTSSFSGNNYIDRWDYFTPQAINGFANTAYNVETTNPAYAFENYLTYTKTLKENHFTVVGGYSANSNTQYNSNASAAGISSTGIYTLQTVPPGPFLSANTLKQRRTTESYYGRLSYDYMGKYLATASVRRDASSIYSSNYRWGTFPAVSVGWIASDEGFFEKAKNTIGFLKLRASYGITGLDPGSYYAKYQALSSDASYWGGTTGTPYNNGSATGAIGGTPTTYNGSSVSSPFPYGNQYISSGTSSSNSVRWEKYPQVDFGTDIQAFDNRVNLTVDWYQKDAIDKYFWNVPAQVTTGYQYYSGNYVNVRNRGLEFALNTRNMSPKSKFQWNINFNISFLKNFVTKLPNGNRDFIFGPAWFQSALTLGKPLFGYKIWKANGVYPTDGSVPTDPITGQKMSYFGTPLQGGDTRIVDQDGNYTIDYNDKIYGGSPNPTGIGGITNTFLYNGFSLTIFCSFSYGNKIVNGFLSDALNGSAGYPNWLGNAGPAALANVLNQFWTKPGDQTRYPRMVYPNATGTRVDPWNVGNSYFLDDGSFLKLKQVRLGYMIPTKWRQSLKVRNINVYLMAENLLILKKSSVPDPELFDPTTGSANTIYPTSLKFTLGASIDL